MLTAFVQAGEGFATAEYLLVVLQLKSGCRSAAEVQCSLRLTFQSSCTNPPK
jgi:hypothetical protein